MAGAVVIDVQVNSQTAVRNLQQVNTASKAAQTGVNGLQSAVTKLASTFAAIGAIKFVFAKTAELETQTRSLEVLTGSADKARQIIAELQQLGAVTPFTSAELIDAAKRLQAFGVEGNKVVETTRRLADVSGATGAELQGLVTAYGQVQAKGRLQGEELLQFQERGVALQQELQKMYGMSGKELQDTLSKGRISSEAVEVAIIRLTDAGGKYANGAIAQSTTLQGKFSTLTDGIESVAKKIGEVLKPALKEILDLAILVINKINESLAGPDYKKANDQLFNTRARIKQLKEEIKAAERAGIGLATGMQIQGVDGQVLAGGAPVLPGMRKELKDLEGDTKRLEARLKELRKPTAKPPTTKPPATPDLLGGDQAKGTRSVNDLLGGQIKRNLEIKKAQLETGKQLALNVAFLQSNATQAQRMVDFAYEYRNVQAEISSLEETIAARTAVRAQFIGAAKDKQSAALAFDEQTAELRNEIARKQIEINTISARHTGQLNEQAKKEEEARIKGVERIQQLRDEQELLQARLNGTEAEVLLKQQIKEITKDTTGLNEKEIAEIINKNNALKEQIAAAEQLKQLYADVGMNIKSSVVDAIQGAIDGTKSLQEVANNLLSSIANKLLDVAINLALFGAMSGTGTGGGLLGGLFKPRANGGSVMAGQGYLVGERGPELFMPGRSGGIAPTGSFGGAGNIVVNVDANGSNVQGDGAQANALGKAIGIAVQQELIKQKRPGGLLA